MNCFRKFLLAVSSVTALPLADLHDDPHALDGLSKFLPAVGLFLGALLCLIAYGLKLLSVSLVVQGLIIAVAWLALTGGIHFDGLMDTADGVFSHRSRERMLAIMQDSRVGNFGVMTGGIVFILKAAALTIVRPTFLFATLLLIPAWARWCETFAIGSFRYAREEGMGKIWHDTTKYPSDVLMSLCLPAVATICCCLTFGWANCVLISAATVVSGIFVARSINSVLGGQTGDTYGAVVELSETGALLLAVLFHPAFK